MATVAQLQERARKRLLSTTPEELTAQLPDIQEIAKLVPQGAELIPGLTEMASGIEESAQARRANITEMAQPGVTQQFGMANQQISQMLQGAMPQDVIDQIQSNVAARSLSGGVAGSGFAANQYARNLGLTSLDLIGRGLGSLLQVTPQQQALFGTETVDIEQNIPGLTDIYSSQASQAMSRAQTAQELYGLMLTNLLGQGNQIVF
jgi:hypothetical protein